MHPSPAVPQQREGHALPITLTSLHQLNLDLTSLFQFLFEFLQLPKKNLTHEACEWGSAPVTEDVGGGDRSRHKGSLSGQVPAGSFMDGS